MTDGQEREASVGLGEAWEVVTRMAGGANVGPRFLSLARLVVSLDKRLAEVGGKVLVLTKLGESMNADVGAQNDEMEEVYQRPEALESVVSSITQGMEDAEKGEWICEDCGHAIHDGLCSDGCTMDGAPRSPEETEIEGTRGLTVEERDAYRRTRARLLEPFEPVSQSSTKTPGIGADI